MPPTKKSDELTIQRLQTETVQVAIVGNTGLYCNRMSAKAKQQLMLGGRKKTAAQRLEIKHDPFAEFSASMHVQPDLHPHSDIGIPAVAFKSAMATAALVTDGMRKTDVQRLVFIPEEFVPVFGVPKLRMDITRSSDMNRTPDVRTRAYFAEWATVITIQYVRPALSRTSILTLLGNAGIVAGVGDNRQEKGKGSYGTFEPANELPEHLLDLEAQRAALADPQPENDETEELLAEFAAEVERRR